MTTTSCGPGQYGLLAPAQEREQETRTGEHAQFLHQLPHGGAFVRLGDVHRAAEHPVEVPRRTGDVAGPAVDEDPPLAVAAHDRRRTVRPPAANRLLAVHDAQHPVVLVDPL